MDFEEVRVCASPIFVLGSPRSGTTMLGWSLAQHSRLWTSGEASVIQGIFQEAAIDSVLENARVLGDGGMTRNMSLAEPKNCFQSTVLGSIFKLGRAARGVLRFHVRWTL